MTVSKIINESVMTSAKPVSCERTNAGCFMVVVAEKRGIRSQGSEEEIYDL